MSKVQIRLPECGLSGKSVTGTCTFERSKTPTKHNLTCPDKGIARYPNKGIPIYSNKEISRIPDKDISDVLTRVFQEVLSTHLFKIFG